MTTDMIARLAAIKDSPTPRLIALAAADADGRIVILESVAERVHREVAGAEEQR